MSGALAELEQDSSSKPARTKGQVRYAAIVATGQPVH